MEKDALKVAQEMKAEYWAVSSLTGESEASGLLLWCSCPPGLSFLPFQLCPVTRGLERPLSTHLPHASGENVREFFFRVAALTFEANVLAELEKSGARRIGDVVRECLPGWGGRERGEPLIPASYISWPSSGIHSEDSNLYLTASKKKPTCCP